MAQAVDNNINAVNTLVLQECLHVLLEFLSIAGACNVIHAQAAQKCVLVLRASCRVNLRTHILRVLDCHKTHTSSGCVDQYSLALPQVCEVAEGLLNCHEDHRHGASIFKVPCWRLLRQERRWANIVGPQAAWRLSEDVITRPDVGDITTDSQHCARTIRTRWSWIAWVQAHYVEHVSEIEANSSDAQLSLCVARLLPRVLGHWTEIRKAAS
mmetsp:Transcript_35810/g.91247  ORF Transcript_35810/g.91247 Transcript_35810/m.91247 type:complete len:212 (-) Transcript_35810:25-660(-)